MEDVLFILQMAGTLFRMLEGQRTSWLKVIDVNSREPQWVAWFDKLFLYTRKTILDHVYSRDTTISCHSHISTKNKRWIKGQTDSDRLLVVSFLSAKGLCFVNLDRWCCYYQPTTYFNIWHAKTSLYWKVPVNSQPLTFWPIYDLLLRGFLEIRQSY